MAKGLGCLGVLLVPALLLAAPPAAAETDQKQARCLALAVYWEAKTEGRAGMEAVAEVVLNRVRSRRFPDTVCEVVQQGGETPPCQFSYWCDGKSDRPAEDPDAWRLAQAVAEDMLGRPPAKDPTRGALFFHSEDIAVPWTAKRRRTAQIGRHIYYR